MAVGQNQWYHFGVGAPPILVIYFNGGWDVHWGYGILTQGHVEPNTSTQVTTVDGRNPAPPKKP